MQKRLTPFEQVCEPVNLLRAWKAVRANRGGAGVDQVTLVQFERNLEGNIKGLAAQLREGRYYPMPARTFNKKKESGGQRTLSVLTVEDRIVQRAVLDALEPLFDPAFSAISFGFRPGRNVEQAVEKLLEYRAAGNVWVVEADVSDLFGSLDHDLLMALVARRVRDKRMLGLLRMWLDCGQVLASDGAAQAAADERGVIERMGDYASNSVNAAVGQLLSEGDGYGYGPYASYRAAQVYRMEDEEQGLETVEELRRRARHEALKGLGRDGALLLLASAAKARRFLSPTALIMAGVGVAAAAAYPAAARYVRERWKAESGVGAMQGGALSPLLSNIYLDEFDRAMLGHGVNLARYADDFVMAAPDERSAHAALELAARELHKLKLRLHPAKTHIRRFSDGDVVWLGYRFHPHLTAAAPAPVDEKMSLAEWWKAARQSVREAPAKVAAQVAPKAAQVSERVQGQVSAGVERVKALWRRKEEK